MLKLPSRIFVGRCIPYGYKAAIDKVVAQYMREIIYAFNPPEEINFHKTEKSLFPIIWYIIETTTYESLYYSDFGLNYVGPN
jgi:hypothetical protein